MSLTDDVQMKQITIETPYHVGQVHIYLAEINGELVLFDTGPPLEDAKKFLRANIDFERLRYVFTTHGHIDHYGLSGFLEQEAGAQIIMSRNAIRQLTTGRQYRQQLFDVFIGLDFPAEKCTSLIEKFDEVSKWAPPPERCLAAEDAGDLMDDLGIKFVSCPWHSQGDLVYLYDDYAVMGDVALRGLFPVPVLDVDFSCPDNGRFDNYGAFCTSIDRLKQLDNKVLLPAHNQYLDDLDGWICFAVTKVVDRAARLVSHYQDGKTIRQTVEDLLGEQTANPLMVYLKASEVALMFDFLHDHNQLKEVLRKHHLYGCVAASFSKLLNKL